MMIQKKFLLSIFLLSALKHHFGNILYVTAGCTNLEFSEPEWLADQYGDQHVYMPSKSDSCKGMKFYWKIMDDTIQITAVAKSNGWLAFGFSETGGMRGADIVYFTQANEQVVDAHVKDFYAKPSIDKQQDWILLNHELMDDGHLLFEVKRKLDSNDSYDRKFVDDSNVSFPNHNLFGAWGDSSDIMYHGNRVVQKNIQLFTTAGENGSHGSGYELFLDHMAKRSEGYVDLIPADYVIPKLTTYETFCFPTPIPDLPSTAYILGLEYFADPSVVKYVHHSVVQSISRRMESACDRKEGSFSNPLFFSTAGNLNSFLEFPEDTAIFLNEEPNSLYGFNLEYHFENRDQDDAVFMNSGLRLHYTSVPVTHEIGSFLSGDPQVELEGLDIGDGFTAHQFVCPKSCTQFSMAIEKVTVISDIIHMHEKGKRASNKVIRDGKVISETSIDYWDYYQNGAVVVPHKSYELHKGDVISTICYYETKPGYKFGFGARDEMCFAGFLYYPRQSSMVMCGLDFGICSISYESVQLASEDDLGRSFGYDNPGSHDPFDSDDPTLTLNLEKSEGMSSTLNNGYITFFLACFGFVINWTIAY